MRFSADGPNIPPELVAAQEKGQAIFVCGAGVSRVTGLPLFRGLVESVYQQLGEDWSLHPAEREIMAQDGKLKDQFDRALRCLERRLAASDAPRNRGMRERIRSAVRAALTPPDGADLGTHLALLELSRDVEGRSRILTTNFDTLFERAWYEKNRAAIDTHAGPAMPQPKVAGFTGVLHLHGRLSDPRCELRASETDLVLTSAEFGDAYLRTGWAARYVYDLVRAYTIVLVGYQADDPPMRYLLEALEADRERFPDLQKVYAFAPYMPHEEELVRALWEAKAVEPILYMADGNNHSTLYASLREWRDYAEAPTAWRRERLRPILAEPPSTTTEEKLGECTALLSHGDAYQLLGELSPAPQWLPVLAQRRIFKQDQGMPTDWIIRRIADASMIKVCAAMPSLDKFSRWRIEQVLELEQVTLNPPYAEAWRLLLRARQAKQPDERDYHWFRAMSRMKKGNTDFESRRVISSLLRPRFHVSKVLQWPKEESAPVAAETLHDLISLDFEAARYPPVHEILAALPHELAQEILLFSTLERALIEALEEAREVGFLDGWDRASYDVPSVAPHGQNSYRTGFYPITRALADLWLRIVDLDGEQARQLVESWATSPFLLVRRLSLFAHEHSAYSPEEAARAVVELDDDVFWFGGRVEVMRLLTARWAQFSDADRQAIETRIRVGERRELYPPNSFENDEQWRSIKDSSLYRRLKRIELAGGALSHESQELLSEISARHPEWRPSSGDRDDFGAWHEIKMGPQGESELLARIADDQLVKEALRLEREQPFDQGDVWRVFCAADPERALRGVHLEAEGGRWDSRAWRSLLYALSEQGDPALQLDIAALIMEMPDSPLRELLPVVASWLIKRRETLSSYDVSGGSLFMPLWDRLADLIYVPQSEPVTVAADGDLLTDALNEPGGQLAWSIVDALGALKPESNSGLPDAIKPRLDRTVAAPGIPGLLARVYLARLLAYLESIDSAWVEEHLYPRLSWDHPEALHLWRSLSHNGDIGSARMFNRLKPLALAAFERQELSDSEFQGLTSKLLSVLIWHQRGQGYEFELTPAEFRRALTVGPASARRNVSWNLWRLMSEADHSDDGEARADSLDRAARWRTVIGPLFRAMWPLDARLRTKSASQNLTNMALECGDSFPEAVEAILDVLVPYQIYLMAHTFGMQAHHSDLVRQHPLAFLKLVNAVIDPIAFPVPSDLGSFLDECIEVEPDVARDPAYVRLHGLRRQRSA